MHAVRLWVTLFSLCAATLLVMAWTTQLRLGQDVAQLGGGASDTAIHDPRVASFFALALILCAGQAVLVWTFRLGSRWWHALAAEVLLAYGIAISSSQALAGTSTSCYDNNPCVTTYPTFFPWAWIGICVSVGLIIGFTWSRATRGDRRVDTAITPVPVAK